MFAVRPLALGLLALSLVACEKKTEPKPESLDPAAFPEAKVPAPPVAEAPPVQPAPSAAVAPSSDAPPAATASAVAPRIAMATAKSAPAASGDPAPVEKEPEPTKGDVVKDAPFAVWLQSAGRYEVGKPGAVTAVVTANDPFKCNDKYPYKLKLAAPPPGVTFTSDVVRGMQVGAKRSTMAVPFTASEAGAKTISGELSFSVCTDEKCLVEKRNVSVTVNVQ